MLGGGSVKAASVGPSLKVSFLGHAEQKAYAEQNEKQRRIQRQQQVKMQESERSRLNLQSMREQEEQNRLAEVQREKMEEYLRLKQLKETLLEQQELQKRELGLAHKQAEEAEAARAREAEEKEKRRQAFEEKKRERTLQAAEWKRMEEYERSGKAKEQLKNKKEMLENLQEKERSEAQAHREYLESLPEPVEEDPLQYELYQRTDNRKGYYSNIDFSKTHFHNPIVIKHEEGDSESGFTQNAIENAEREFQRTQKENFQKLQTMKIRKDEAQERGAASLKEVQNARELRRFSAEMEQAKKVQEAARVEKENASGSAKPATLHSKDVNRKASVEKAFNQEFFGEKAEWAAEEIPEPKKQSSNSKKNNNNANANRSSSAASTNAFERKALENAAKSQKNVKIFRKPPLDSNVYSKSSKGISPKKNQHQNDEDEDDNANDQGRRTLQNNHEQQQQQQGGFRESNRESTSERKKKIRFVSAQKSEEDDSQNENQENEDNDFTDQGYLGNRRESDSHSYNNNQQQLQQQYRYAGGSGVSGEKDFTEDESMMERTGSSGGSSSGNNYNNSNVGVVGRTSVGSLGGGNAGNTRESVRSYIREQEDYLKKLEDDRKSIRDRMKQEEEALLSTLNRATNTMQSKSKERALLSGSEENSSASFGHRNNNNNNNNGQLNSSSRQIVYSSKPTTPMPASKANDILQQFLNPTAAAASATATGGSRMNSTNPFLQQKTTGGSRSPFEGGEDRGDFTDSKLDQYSRDDQHDDDDDMENDRFNERSNSNRYNDSHASKGQMQQYLQSDFTDSQASLDRSSRDESHYNREEVHQKQQQSSYGRGNNQGDQFYQTFSPNKDRYNYQEYIAEEGESQVESEEDVEHLQRTQTASKQALLGGSTGFNRLSQSKGAANTNSKDNIELSESLFTSHNFQSQIKNTRNQNNNSALNQHANRRSEFSPTSELSYSLSEFGDKSADKVRKNPSDVFSQKKRIPAEMKEVEMEEDPARENRQRTAKFGEALNKKPSNGAIQMNIQFNDDEGEDEVEQGVSLAEMFKKKKGGLARKYEEEQERKPKQEPKKERTKEEILRQRKEMMKRPDFLKSQQQQQQQSAEYEDGNEGARQAAGNAATRGMMKSFHDPNKQIKEPSQELMDRLANGTKAKIDKQDYLKLTNKNYELLPEIRKKKEEEQKKEEFRRRQETVKQLQQVSSNSLSQPFFNLNHFPCMGWIIFHVFHKVSWD